MPADLHDSPDVAPPAAGRNQGAVSREEVLAHLRVILGAPDFRTSKRCQEFLTYVVEHALTYPDQALKERTIGVEALGRPANYDTNTDGVVRIKASEVRKRLQLHYARAGPPAEIQIALPAGSYIPIFSKAIARAQIAVPQEHADQHAELDKPPAEPPASLARSRSPGYSRWTAVILFCVLVASLLGAAALWRQHAATQVSVLQEFWQPVLDSASPILVATDYAPVYLPPPNTDADASPATYVLLKDQYVGGGDLIAAAKISSLLTAAGHPYTLRMGTAASFDDLRNTPTVLIGYSSTQWSEVTKNFRYYIDDGDLGMIRDNGSATEWYPHNRSDDYHVRQDFALVSRAFDPQTHSHAHPDFGLHPVWNRRRRPAGH